MGDENLAPVASRTATFLTLLNPRVARGHAFTMIVDHSNSRRTTRHEGGECGTWAGGDACLRRVRCSLFARHGIRRTRTGRGGAGTDPQAIRCSPDKSVSAVVPGLSHTGAGGAPLTGDRQAWDSRWTKGQETLRASTVRGLNGMPPGGQCFACTPADYDALIRFMAGREQE